jgi:hypothetical protein
MSVKHFFHDTMKKIDLNLNYDKILRRIDEDKARYKVGEWAEMMEMSIGSVSNIHGKSSRINPSIEYVVKVARKMCKPVDWYLYGTYPGQG